MAGQTITEKIMARNSGRDSFEALSNFGHGGHSRALFE